MSLHSLIAGQADPAPELFKLMAETVQDYAIFLLDPGGHIASWNLGARLIKQYEAEDVIGRHFSLFYTPEDIARDWPTHELRLAARDGRFEDAGWRVRKNGTRFWANVIITALRGPNGELLAFSKITRDLTKRKQQDEILRESEERFRLMVEGVQDYAIYMLDPEGIVTSWNAGARRITGYESPEILGRHFSVFYQHEDSAAGKPAMELAVAREHGRAEDAGWRVRKDGTRFWARVVVTALYDDNANLRGFAKVTQDLTQRRHAEALENSTRNIHEFIAVLAHELRNPLAPIRNAVHLMKLGRQDQAPRDDIVQIIDRQSGQLMRIVDDILDISRITRGTFAVIRKPAFVRDLITRAVEAARPGIEAREHTLAVDIANAPLMLEGDEVRIAQALTNILNNAARYTEPGGHIALEALVATRAGKPELVISVRDNGRGIEPRFIGAIFGMFVQGHEKRSNAGTGLGVGLALARSIVELHHGSLEARSEGPGKGSEFIIRLPLMEGAVENEPEPETASGLPVPAHRILIVDDNEDAAVVLASFYRELGHRVYMVNNGEEALAVFDEFKPELVLLDVGMPGMSGLELARRIRRRTGGKGVLIVAVTGWGKPEDEARSRRAGIDLHLVKPAESAQLLALLETAPTVQAKEA